ncbi:MAG: hypothetical protein AB9879_02830 [Methanothrix sp.]|jgi:hypothetical protein
MDSAKEMDEKTNDIAKLQKSSLSRPAPIHSALLRGTKHRSDGLTRPKRLDMKPGE